MKKRKHIGIIIAVVILAAGIFYIVNGIWGNPISKRMAEQGVKAYIAENYPNQNLQIKGVSYNFKINGYSAEVVSETSIDTHFSVDTSMSGKVRSDSYDDVISGWNTYMRLESGYRSLVEAVFDNENFPLVSDIDYGELQMLEKYNTDSETAPYGISMSTLERDKQYDLKEIGKTNGHIVYYVKDADVSYKKASELLLLLKCELDKAEIPFYAIDFVLEEENESEKPADADAPRINVENFLYEDIYEDGLEARVQTADEKLTAHYEQLDALRKE